MCDDRKLEGVGVVGNVVGIHFGWDSADHFGNPAVYNRDLAFGFAQRREGRDQYQLDGRVVATRAHRTSCEVHSNAGEEEATFARAHPWTSKPK